MAVGSSHSFLICIEQHTNLKLRTFYLRLKREQILPEQNRSTKTYRDRPNKSYPTDGYTQEIIDSQSRLNYLQNEYLEQ